MSDIDAWGGITRTTIPREDATEYFELFNLKESFADVPERGDVDELILFFAIEDNQLNREKLNLVLGRNWQSNFIRKLRLPDNKDDRKRAYTDPDGNTYESIVDAMDARVGNPAYDYTYGVSNLIGSEWDETMYKYFPTPAFFDRMNNEVAGIVIGMGIDISIGYEDPEWWEKALQILLVVVIAWLLGPQTVVAYFAAAVQIIVISFDIELSPAFGIVMSIIALDPTALALMGPLQLSMAIANLALEVATVYQDMSFKNDMKEAKSEYERARDEFDAALMQEQLKFTFGTGFFRSYMNDGIHKDPNTFYYDTYNDFAIYKNTSYNMWDQIE